MTDLWAPNGEATDVQDEKGAANALRNSKVKRANSGKVQTSVCKIQSISQSLLIRPCDET
jgi:hypothetical protein